MDIFLRAPDQKQRCQSCVNYKMELQAANARIAQLEGKLSRLQLAMTLGNGKLDNQIQSTEDFNYLEVSYKDTAHETTEQMDPLIESVKVEPIANDDSVVLPIILTEDDMVELSSDESMKESVSESSAEVESNLAQPFEAEQSILKRNKKNF